MNIKISKLNIHDYHKCSNIWNMEKQKELADIFYKEILSGNRAVYIYSIDDEYIAEISLVYENDDGDYTIPGKRAYVSRLVWVILFFGGVILIAEMPQQNSFGAPYSKLSCKPCTFFV